MQHLCPVCGGTLPSRPKRLTCKDCWFFIPKDLKRAVFSTWRKFSKSGTERTPDNPLWMEWAKAAVAAVEFLNPNSPELLEFKEFAGLLEGEV